jgi:SAM-dependent methyltransferase
MYIIDRTESRSKKKVVAYYEDEFYSERVLAGLRLNPGYVRYYLKLLRRLGVRTSGQPSKRLLDVACGIGDFLHVAKDFADVYGVDVSCRAVSEAAKRVPQGHFVCCAAESLPYENSFFDYVVSLGSIEHFVEIEGALAEMGRVLKSDGKILLMTPNLYSWYNLIKVWVFKVPPDDSGQQFVRLGGYVEWKALFERSGFSLEAFYGDWYMTEFRNLCGISRFKMFNQVLYGSLKLCNNLFARYLIPAVMHYQLFFILKKNR